MLIMSAVGVLNYGFTDGRKKVLAGNADGAGAPIELRGHTGPITSVAFSPDGKKVVTGSRDKTARIWRVASDALLAALWDATTDCLPIICSLP